MVNRGLAVKMSPEKIPRLSQIMFVKEKMKELLPEERFTVHKISLPVVTSQAMPLTS